MGSFPYMNPHSITFIPGTNASENIGFMPIFVAPTALTVTGVSIVPLTAVTGATTNDEIYMNLVQLANTTNKVATLRVSATVNLAINTAQAFTVNSTVSSLTKGAVLGLNVSLEDEENSNFGNLTQQCVYQIDYVQGSPGSEG